MQISENPRGWLGRVDLDSGSYFRFQGSGAAILKGFATIIRGRRRISHQQWRSPCQKLENPKSEKIRSKPKNGMLKHENDIVGTPTHGAQALCVLWLGKLIPKVVLDNSR